MRPKRIPIRQGASVFYRPVRGTRSKTYERIPGAPRGVGPKTVPRRQFDKALRRDTGGVRRARSGFRAEPRQRGIGRKLSEYLHLSYRKVMRHPEWIDAVLRARTERRHGRYAEARHIYQEHFRPTGEYAGGAGAPGAPLYGPREVTESGAAEEYYEDYGDYDDYPEFDYDEFDDFLEYLSKN